MNLIRIRPSYAPPIFVSDPSGVRVGFDFTFSKVGVAPDTWVVVSTKASRAFADKAQDLKVGDLVRFTAQYGLRSDSDSSNMISVSARVVAPRNPLTPDAYTVSAQEIVDSNELDPSVPMPYVGQVFLVAPASISAVEVVAPPDLGDTFGGGGDTTRPYSDMTRPILSEPSPDEMIGKTVAPEAKAAPPPAPPPAGAAPLPKPPEKSRTDIYIGLGVAAVALIGLGVWRFWPGA